MVPILILLMKEMKYRGAKPRASRSEPGLSPGLPDPRLRHSPLALSNIAGSPRPTCSAPLAQNQLGQPALASRAMKVIG